MQATCMKKPSKSVSEPDGLMAGKEIKVIPHTPFYKQNGCSVVKEWQENFTDRVGNKAILTHIEYKDKKDRIHTCVIRVKWSN